MRDVDSALRSLPPVFDLADAAREGLSARTTQRAVRRALVHRLAPGLFTPMSVWCAAGARERHLLLATAAVRRFPGLPLSHHTAATVHGLPTPLRLPSWVALTTDRSANTCRSGRLARLEPALLPAAHVGCRRGLLVTLPARTVVDCLRRLPLSDAVAIADAALRRGMVTRASLEAMRQTQSGWPGVGDVDTGIGLLDAARETWFESWSFTRLWLLGVEVPAAQVSVFDARGRFVARVDGLWTEGGTVAEADGMGKYLGQFDPDGPSAAAAARAVVAEKSREDRLRGCGLEVVRFDVPGMRDHADDVVSSVSEARDRGDLGRFTGRLVFHPLSPADCLRPTPPLPDQLVAHKRRKSAG